MAPNNAAKPAFICKSDYEPSKNDCEDRKAIRTDFILQNIFSHMVAPVSNFQAIKAANDEERKIICELKGIVDCFRKDFEGRMQFLCSELNVTVNLLSSSVQTISNELFCEGITWSKIVALFAFVGEFTIQCLSRESDTNIVDMMYECFCRQVKENLIGWIEDHGGWDGVRSLSKIQEQCLRKDQSNKGWAKTFLHGTVRMIGALAQIANQTQNYL